MLHEKPEGIAQVEEIFGHVVFWAMVAPAHGLRRDPGGDLFGGDGQAASAQYRRSDWWQAIALSGEAQTLP